MTLVIMAAGMGSRFGGLKQIEPVGPEGEIIIDYSIYDAIKAGFKKVVFIIKEENLDLFKKVIGDKVSKFVEVEYVFQNNKNILELTGIEPVREKPFGTGHAVLCAKNAVGNDNFAVINADDFYGRDAFMKIAEFLKKTTQDKYAMVGYYAKNTTTDNGAVKRGICKIENGNLVSLIESSISKKGDEYLVEPSSGEPSFTVNGEQLVSMNIFGFTPKFFEYLEFYLKEFIEKNKEDLSKVEFFLPEVVCKLIKEGKVTTEVLSTTSEWHGVTYREDKELVVAAIKELTDKGIYPSKI